ncbi:MAG: fused MFS/spermidine synthase, partial [Deltaproteobacteria bacterium]|nr:fused MFS/spermidine synthase [Deltaproteobacteria bacterium]
FGVALTELLSALSASEGVALAIAGSPGGLRILLSALLLLPPTVAMGATLPILTRWVARSLPDLGRHFTGLYALNTLGAAAGCSLAGFWAIPSLGLTGTAWVAAVVNFVAAASAFVLHFLGRPGEDGDGDGDGDGVEESTPTAMLGDRQRRTLIGVFALTGFLSIAYEVLWFRSLGLFVHSSVYAFTALLSTFLLGLVIGAAVYALWLQPKRRDLSILATAQVLQALAGLVTLALLTNGKTIDFFLTGALGSPLLALWVQALAILLVPASIIGVGFPLVVQATATHLSQVGRQVGWLYSLNTLGGIAGSLGVGFVLVPLIGTQWTFVLLALLGAALALFIQGLDAEVAPRQRRLTRVAAGLVLLAAFLLPPGTFLRSYAETRLGEVLDVVEGRDGTIAVIEYSADAVCRSRPCPDHCREHPYRHRQVRYASMSYASTILYSRRYMTSLLNLAALTGPPTRQALVVCFGTGITAGTATLHPELEGLTIVDVNRDVVEADRFFEDFNHRVLSDPRARVVIDDGRHFLAAAPEEARWDVISFEPPPPEAPGIVNLYSSEFYRLAKRHLSPGGRLTQWVPLQEQSDEINRRLARSLVDNFEYVTLWIPARDEAVYLASDAPLEIDLERWREAFARPELKASLREAGLDDVHDLLSTFVLDAEGMREWTREVEPITDDHPAVEYYLSFEGRPHDRDALWALSTSLLPYLKGEVSPEDRTLLERRRSLARELSRVSALTFDWRYDEAAEALDALIAEHGESTWLHHLRHDQLDCMVERPGLPPGRQGPIEAPAP